MMRGPSSPARASRRYERRARRRRRRRGHAATTPRPGEPAIDLEDLRERAARARRRRARRSRIRVSDARRCARSWSRADAGARASAGARYRAVDGRRARRPRCAAEGRVARQRAPAGRGRPRRRHAHDRRPPTASSCAGSDRSSTAATAATPTTTRRPTDDIVVDRPESVTRHRRSSRARCGRGCVVDRDVPLARRTRSATSARAARRSDETVARRVRHHARAAHRRAVPPRPHRARQPRAATTGSAPTSRCPRRSTGSDAECAFAVVHRGPHRRGRPARGRPARRSCRAGSSTRPTATSGSRCSTTACSSTRSSTTAASSRSRCCARPATSPAPSSSLRPNPAGPLDPLEGPQLQRPGRGRVRGAPPPGRLGARRPARPRPTSSSCRSSVSAAAACAARRAPPTGRPLRVEGAVVSAVHREPGGLVVRVLQPVAATDDRRRSSTTARPRPGGASTCAAGRSSAFEGESSSARRDRHRSASTDLDPSGLASTSHRRAGASTPTGAVRSGRASSASPTGSVVDQLGSSAGRAQHAVGAGSATSHSSAGSGAVPAHGVRDRPATRRRVVDLEVLTAQAPASSGSELDRRRRRRARARRGTADAARPAGRGVVGRRSRRPAHGAAPPRRAADEPRPRPRRPRRRSPSPRARRRRSAASGSGSSSTCGAGEVDAPPAPSVVGRARPASPRRACAAPARAPRPPRSGSCGEVDRRRRVVAARSRRDRSAVAVAERVQERDRASCPRAVARRRARGPVRRTDRRRASQRR